MLVALAAALLLVNYIRKYRGDTLKRTDSPDSLNNSGNRSFDKKGDEDTRVGIAETKIDHGVSELWRRISKQERTRSSREEVRFVDETGGTAY